MSGSIVPINALNNQAQFQGTLSQSLSGSQQDKGKLSTCCGYYEVVQQRKNIEEALILSTIECPLFGTEGSIDSSSLKAFCLDSYLLKDVDTTLCGKYLQSPTDPIQDCEKARKQSIASAKVCMTEKQFKIMKEKAIKDLAFYANAIEDGVITDDEFENMPLAYKARAAALQKIFTKCNKADKDDAIVGEKLNIASYEDYLGVK